MPTCAHCPPPACPTSVERLRLVPVECRVPWLWPCPWPDLLRANDTIVLVRRKQKHSLIEQRLKTETCHKWKPLLAFALKIFLHLKFQQLNSCLLSFARVFVCLRCCYHKNEVILSLETDHQIHEYYWDIFCLADRWLPRLDCFLFTSMHIFRFVVIPFSFTHVTCLHRSCTITI